jgi:hypothetical protein
MASLKIKHTSRSYSRVLFAKWLDIGSSLASMQHVQGIVSLPASSNP